jgi:hypothetical protein
LRSRFERIVVPWFKAASISVIVRLAGILIGLLVICLALGMFWEYWNKRPSEEVARRVRDIYGVCVIPGSLQFRVHYDDGESDVTFFSYQYPVSVTDALSELERRLKESGFQKDLSFDRDELAHLLTTTDRSSRVAGWLWNSYKTRVLVSESPRAVSVLVFRDRSNGRVRRRWPTGMKRLVAYHHEYIWKREPLARIIRGDELKPGITGSDLRTEIKNERDGE